MSLYSVPGKFLGGCESNFLLIESLDRLRSIGGKASNEAALAVYERLAETKGVRSTLGVHEIMALHVTSVKVPACMRRIRIAICFDLYNQGI